MTLFETIFDLLNMKRFSEQDIIIYWLYKIHDSFSELTKQSDSSFNVSNIVCDEGPKTTLNLSPKKYRAMLFQTSNF
jgi:hypothetical protein